MEDRISWAQTALILFRQRKFIGACTLGAVLVSIGVSLVLPKWYKARATILPPETATTQTDVVGIMRYAGYQPAMLPTLTSPSDIYGAILESDRVRNAVIDSLDLIESLGVGTRIKALARLKKRTDVSVTPEGLVKIEYEDRDRLRAAQVTNSLVRELDRFNREAKVTSARRVRQFIENRIQEAMAELESAETALQKFKETTGAVLIDAQTRASIETAADIYGKIAEREVSLERLRQYATDRSPEILDIKSQIRAMERKLAEMGYMQSDTKDTSGTRLFPRFSTAPELEKRLAELLREVEIKRSVYQVLSQQYEEARIQEMKDTPTLQVLDWAHPPMVRSRPQRKMIVAVSAVLALLLSSFLAFYRDRAGPAAGASTGGEGADLMGMVSHDLRQVRNLFRRGQGRS